MEKAKKDLKQAFEKYKNEGLPLEEALSKAIAEVRERHEEENFAGAFRWFLKEVLESYKLENLTEADPFVSLSEAIFEEYEILLAKIRTLFGKGEESS
jgi:hypothetical protein